MVVTEQDPALAQPLCRMLPQLVLDPQFAKDMKVFVLNVIDIVTQGSTAPNFRSFGIVVVINPDQDYLVKLNEEPEYTKVMVKEDGKITSFP